MLTRLFYLDVRTEWEHTIENMSVLEKVDEDTLIFLQEHPYRFFDPKSFIGNNTKRNCYRMTNKLLT